MLHSLWTGYMICSMYILRLSGHWYGLTRAVVVVVVGHSFLFYEAK